MPARRSDRCREGTPLFLPAAAPSGLLRSARSVSKEACTACTAEKKNACPPMRPVTLSCDGMWHTVAIRCAPVAAQQGRRYRAVEWRPACGLLLFVSPVEKEQTTQPGGLRSSRPDLCLSPVLVTRSRDRGAAPRPRPFAVRRRGGAEKTVGSAFRTATNVSAPVRRPTGAEHGALTMEGAAPDTLVRRGRQT